MNANRIVTPQAVQGPNDAQGTDGMSTDPQTQPAPTTPGTQPQAGQQPNGATPGAAQPNATPAPQQPGTAKPVAAQDGTVFQPERLDVLINKLYKLPAGYVPPSLIHEQALPFLGGGGGERGLMRKEAAEALQAMFAAAKRDGLALTVASAYRSQETQRQLFNSYVQTQGEAVARRYSAEPGHSEHQTGLAVDVSGADGVCAVEDCFADTKEAHWVAQHAPEYGFIVRYPKGKEQITGYAYEPWHLRFVGVALAKDVTAKGLTLEEYFLQDPPTNNQFK